MYLGLAAILPLYCLSMHTLSAEHRSFVSEASVVLMRSNFSLVFAMYISILLKAVFLLFFPLVFGFLGDPL